MGHFSFRGIKNWNFLLAAIALFAGFVLTIVSWMQICSVACTEIHFYKFYGYSFELLGIFFFSTLLVLHVASWWNPLLGHLAALLLAVAVGSEINFILVQKFVIGQWCPVCLSIAACLGVAALIYVVDALQEAISAKEGELAMFFKKSIISFTALAIGFFVAFFGVAKPDQSFAAGIDNKGDPIFGNKKSSVEVYVVTDWFCPACRYVEPSLEEIYPEIMEKARLMFIDLPLHRESLNFTPYNLSFMINNKDKYIQIRRILHKLSDSTKSPTVEEIQKAVKPLGVKYQQLNYSDVDGGIRYFKGITDTFEVQNTPTVVVSNRKNLQAKKFVGVKEITKENILNAINEMSK